jgi:hypothetical protein
MNHLDQWQSPDVHAVCAGVAAPARCSCKRKAYAVAGVEAQGSAGKPRNVNAKEREIFFFDTTSFLQLGLMIGIADSKFHFEGPISVREVMPFIKLINCSPNGSHLSDDSLSGITRFSHLSTSPLISVLNLSQESRTSIHQFYCLPQRDLKGKIRTEKEKKNFLFSDLTPRPSFEK